jgi:hypothetical protein
MENAHFGERGKRKIESWRFAKGGRGLNGGGKLGFEGVGRKDSGASCISTVGTEK